MKEIIAFFVNGKEYGIEISGMQSLENYQEVTPFPEAPDCILGTIKIRDEVYPVYDIRAKLGIPSAITVTETTKMLLLHTKEGTLACVVDSVGKVFRADGDNVQPFPKVARTDGTEYIDFVVKRGNDLLVVIDPNELLSNEDSECVKKIDFSEKKEEE